MKVSSTQRFRTFLMPITEPPFFFLKTDIFRKRGGNKLTLRPNIKKLPCLFIRVKLSQWSTVSEHKFSKSPK